MGGNNVSTLAAVDQTLMAPPHGNYQYRTTGGDHEDSINALSTEPPQYLVAQPCTDTSQILSEVDQTKSTSQIEQIMARYEQLCRKLDN